MFRPSIPPLTALVLLPLTSPSSFVVVIVVIVVVVVVR